MRIHIYSFLMDYVHVDQAEDEEKNNSLLSEDRQFYSNYTAIELI